MINAFSHPQYVGLQRTAPTKNVVHVFDLDDTITVKPEGFDNTGMSKDDFFDASRKFTPDQQITGYCVSYTVVMPLQYALLAC